MLTHNVDILHETLNIVNIEHFFSAKHAKFTIVQIQENNAAKTTDSLFVKLTLCDKSSPDAIDSAVIHAT